VNVNETTLPTEFAKGWGVADVLVPELEEDRIQRGKVSRRRIELLRKLVDCFRNGLVVGSILIDEIVKVRRLDSNLASRLQNPKTFAQNLGRAVVCKMLNALLGKDVIEAVVGNRKGLVLVHVYAVEAAFAAGWIRNIGVQPVAIAFGLIVGPRSKLKDLRTAEIEILSNDPGRAL